MALYAVDIFISLIDLQGNEYLMIILNKMTTSRLDNDNTPDPILTVLRIVLLYLIQILFTLYWWSIVDTSPIQVQICTLLTWRADRVPPPTGISVPFVGKALQKPTASVILRSCVDICLSLFFHGSIINLWHREYCHWMCNELFLTTANHKRQDQMKKIRTCELLLELQNLRLRHSLGAMETNQHADPQSVTP